MASMIRRSEALRWKINTHERLTGFRNFAMLAPSVDPKQAQYHRIIRSCQTSADKKTLTITFRDARYTFHSQWLKDARLDNGSYRVMPISQQPPTARIQSVRLTNQGIGTMLNVTWDDGSASEFPATWLQVLAPSVAKCEEGKTASSADKGWQVQQLSMPVVRYEDILMGHSTLGQWQTTISRILDDLLHESKHGIIKVVGLPKPDIESERRGVNSIVTRVLKEIFGSVFRHPIRGPDSAFVVASQDEQAIKGVTLPNYDTNRQLLPHIDHCFYENPVRIEGFYGLEGESRNTFVSSLAVLETLRDENPELFDIFCVSPFSHGRVALHYGPPIYQAVVDTPVMMHSTARDKIKRVRWHPHLAGPLLTSFDKYVEARRANEKFLEIAQRDTHQFRVRLKPGDLYIWDNYRIMHGRDGVLTSPRTGAGQTVPEQVAMNRYRWLKVAQLKDWIDPEWLVHMSVAQLHDLHQLIQTELNHDLTHCEHVPTVGC